MSESIQKVMKGASLVFAGSFLQVGIAFVAKALMARFLAVNQYGFVSLGIVIINLGATVALLGLDDGVARFIPRYDGESELRNVVYSSYVLTVTGSLLVVSLLFVLAGPISRLVFNDDTLAPVLRVMIFGVPFWVLLDLGIGTVRGNSIVLPRVYAKNLLLPSSRFVLVAIAIVFGSGILGVASAYVLSYVLTGLFITGFVVRTVPVPDLRALPTNVRDLLSFSIPLGIKNLGGFLISNADLIMLGMFHTAASVAVYNVAYPVARLLTIFPGAFNYLFMPVVSDLHSEAKWDEMRQVFQVSSKWMIFATTPIFLSLVIFPAPMISTLFGSKYVEGALTLSILSVGFYTSIFAGLNSSTIISMGESRIILWGQIVTLIINVALNFLLIPQYGFLGAGVATAISYMLREFLYSVYLYRETGIHPVSTGVLKPIVVSGVSFIGLYFFVTSLFATTLWLLGATFVIFFGVFVVSILRFGGIGSEDVMLLNAAESKSGVDLEPVKLVLKYLI